MERSICKIDCTKYQLNHTCKGFIKTNGHPFGNDCVVAMCLKEAKNNLCEFKTNLIKAINSLDISDMEEVKELKAL